MEIPELGEYVEESNEEENMSNFYDEIKFPNYDDLEDYASLYDKGRKQIFTRKLDEELSYSSNILELGCGTGQLSLFLARGNREICGVDISDSSLRMGEKFRKENNIENVYFMKMDVFDLKFKDNSFDFIISNGVLHHTKDAKEAFKKLVKVLKPGGIIVIGLYHKYGRTVTRIKQLLAKLFSQRIQIFDRKSMNIKSKEKRNAWVRDQFLNPHETLHTPKEVLKWFDESEIEFMNLIPHFDITKNKVIKQNLLPNLSRLKEILLAFNSTQIEEGGFFIIIGKK